MISQIKWVLRIIGVGCCIPLLLPQLALADFQIFHDSRQVKLGPAGSEAEIRVKLLGTKQTAYPLNVEIVRDGKLSFATIPLAAFNEFDEPQYIFSVASPKAGLVYRFHLRDEEGKTYQSQYYWVLQKCQETNEFVVPQPAPGDHAGDRAEKFALEALKLEKVLLRSNFAEKRLQQLGLLLNGGKQ